MVQKGPRVEITVGLFAIIALIILFVALFAIFQERGTFQEKYTLTAIFNDVSGLEVGSPVTLAGVDEGIVTGVEILGKEQVKVTLSINQEAQKWITTDSVAQIASTSIMGGKCVKISVGSRSPQTPVIKNGGQIEKTKDLFEPLEGIEKIAEKVNPTLDSIKTAAEDAGELVTSLTGPIQEAEKLARELYAYTQEIFSDTGMYSDMQIALDNLNKIGDPLAESIPEIAKRSEAIMANLEEISEDVKELEINRTISEVAEEIKKVSQSIQGLAEEATKGIEEASEIVEAMKKHWLVRRYLESETEEESISIRKRDSHYQE